MGKIDEDIGEGIGCFLAAFGVGICITLIIWAMSGFPGLR
jgi:hypothetical protein